MRSRYAKVNSVSRKNIGMISFAKAKKIFVPVAVAAFATVWLYLMIATEPRPKSRWMSPEAKAFVTSSLQDFCDSISPDGGCSNVRYMAKQYWIGTGSINLPVERVDAALLKLGWKKSSKSDESRFFYCKAEYTARIDPKNGAVNSISFLGGSYKCADS